MNAVDEIQDAIVTLERLKAESTPGEWWSTRDLDYPDVFAGDGLSDDPSVASELRLPADAQLIVTLHRTIDAQLDWLRDQASRMRAELNTIGSPEVHYRHALALARAINGGTN